MEMTMFDIGCINYKVRNGILLPNIHMIANAVSGKLKSSTMVNNNGFIIESVEEIPIHKVSETVRIALKTILFDNILHITNNCIGYSPSKTEADAVYYISTYANTLYTCIQLSPNTFNIILV